MKTRSIFSALTDSLAIILFLYLLVFPQSASEPTRNALYFCAQTLIPSLFIYMVLAKMIISLPATDRLAKRIGTGSIVFISGILCGCPIGAKMALSLYESGRIDKRYAEYLCAFTNNASVSFVVGYVGGELFGSRVIGIRLFIFQIIASAVTALLMKRFIYGKTHIKTIYSESAGRVPLREAVTDSAQTMISVCACAVFFIVAASSISGFLGLPPIWDAVLKCLLEFSSGCAAGARLDSGALGICAFSIGFTGLSVFLQVKSVVSGKLSTKPFAVGKLISATVMTMLSLLSEAL